ncbi:MAG: hypothetical protein ACLQGP_14690 [Isosphaeraceae bacterium]
MEPTLAREHGDLHELRLDLLRRAVEIYLELAYSSGVVPEMVRRRLKWREDCAADELLSGPPFECTGEAPGRQTSIYALRLGNARYPNMKLQIQPWPNDAGFMLSVNTHDQVAGVSLSVVDAQVFRDLQSENQRLKEAIEQAWDESGLPTFLRYLRDYIESRRDDSSAEGPDDRAQDGPSASDQTSRS